MTDKTTKNNADEAQIKGQQHTGNHDRSAREQEGNEKLGGTRAGKENVERKLK